MIYNINFSHLKMSEHYCCATLSIAITINGEKMENKKFEMLDSEYKKSLNELCHYDDKVVEKCLQLRLENKPIENLLSENVRSNEPRRMVKFANIWKTDISILGRKLKIILFILHQGTYAIICNLILQNV